MPRSFILYFCLHSCHPTLSRAYSHTPTYSTVLTIAHFDGTSILSLHIIHPNALKAFSDSVATDITATPALATWPSTKSTSSLARQDIPSQWLWPHGRQRHRLARGIYKHYWPRTKTTNAEGVSTSKETINDSGNGSQQTIPNASIFNDNSVEPPSTLYENGECPRNKVFACSPIF
jgi:hypothetical protein